MGAEMDAHRTFYRLLMVEVEVPDLVDREKELVIDALKKSRSKQSEAARMLEISRDKLRYKMKKFELG